MSRQRRHSAHPSRRPSPTPAHRYACEVVWNCARQGRQQADLWLVMAPSHRAATLHVGERLTGLDDVTLRCWRTDEPPAERIELLWRM